MFFARNQEWLFGVFAKVTLLEISPKDLWKSALDIHEVSPHDRFADLGGSEIIAADLVESVRIVFDVDLTSASLFEDGDTVAKMAEMISRAKAMAK